MKERLEQMQTSVKRRKDNLKRLKQSQAIKNFNNGPAIPVEFIEAKRYSGTETTLTKWQDHKGYFYTTNDGWKEEIVDPSNYKHFETYYPDNWTKDDLQTAIDDYFVEYKKSKEYKELLTNQQREKIEHELLKEFQMSEKYKKSVEKRLREYKRNLK